MSLFAISLLIVSAFTHAAWNFIGKRQHPTAAFFLLANSIGVLFLSPIVLWHLDKIGAMSEHVWVLLAATGLCQAVYYTALAGAYREGDMSVAYPLARSLPAIMVTVAALLLGRGNQLSWQCLVGILLAVSGCFLVPMKRFGDFHARNYRNAACALAVLAALGTAGYSLADDEALQLVRAVPSNASSGTSATLVYLFFEGLAASAWLALLVFAHRPRCEMFYAVLARTKRTAALTGFGIYLTYSLVLVSLAHVNNVSYVVGFRQASIPIGAMLGICVLKEPGYASKVAGVLLMFIGLFLIGTG